MLERYHKRKAYYIDLMGGKCVLCGSEVDLEIDHIDPSTKEFALGKAFAGFSTKRIEQEIKKCQLLCKSCHIEKTNSTRVRSEHGTKNRYLKYKCRCGICKAYMRVVKKKSRREKAASVV